MKTLLSVTGVLELGAGLALLICPSVFVALLVGGTLETAAAWVVARVGAAALLALGVACWAARNDSRNDAARGVVHAMVLYNLGVALALGAAGFQALGVGVLLWPTVILHAVMAGWCLVALRSEPGKALPPERAAG